MEATTTRRRVMDALTYDRDGMTSSDLARYLGMKYATVSARVAELKAAGKIVDSGRRHPKRNGRGGMAAIWITEDERQRRVRAVRRDAALKAHGWALTDAVRAFGDAAQNHSAVAAAFANCAPVRRQPWWRRLFSAILNFRS